MPKNKILEADLEDEARENDTDTDADGAPLFDDLSPRFVRNLDAAVAKAEGKKPAKVQAEEEDETEDEDLDDADPADEEDEDPTPETDEDEESTDEDDVDADEPRRGNPAFEKRLAREARLREEDRAQIAELQARERERETKDKIASNENEYTTFKDATETKLAKLKKELVAATENAETEKQLDLQDQISDLKADLRVKTDKYTTAKTALEEAKTRKVISPIVATKVAQWKRRNPKYGVDKEFTNMVNSIDGALINSGSDNETDEHYQNLDKKLRKLYPDIVPKVRTKQRRHPSTQLAQGGERTRPSGEGKVKVGKGGKLSLSPARLKKITTNMEKFGLETTTEGIRDYIRNNPGL